MSKKYANVMFVSVVMVGLSACALSAQPYEEGMKAYEKGDYQSALKEFQQAAREGNVNGQYSLGLMYQDGIGVEQDLEQAQKYFAQAAKQGSKQAKTHLVEIHKQQYRQAMEAYEKGNYKKALQLFKRLAEQGMVDAQYNLGLVYQDGLFGEVNKTLAKQYFEQAAQQGSEAAQKALLNFH